jgi:hypothetical protein
MVHIILSITTTAVSRANKGVNATGVKEAPFRSCGLLLHKTKTRVSQ